MSAYTTPFHLQVVLPWIQWFIEWYQSQFEEGTFVFPIDLTETDTDDSDDESDMTDMYCYEELYSDTDSD